MANITTVNKRIWTDEIFGICPGASPKGVELALKNAIREFCKDSGAWQVELWDLKAGDVVPFNLGAAAPFYDFQSMIETERALTGPAYTSGDSETALTEFPTIQNYYPWDILYINSVAYFDKYVVSPNPSTATQTATSFLSPMRADNRTQVGSIGQPKVFKTYNHRLGTLQLYPTLLGDTANNEGIVPIVSLGFDNPSNTMDLDNVPMVFQRLWYDVILDGCVGRLMSQQDKPYTNPALAQYHVRRFRNGISRARDEARRQFNTANDGFVFPAWA